MRGEIVAKRFEGKGEKTIMCQSEIPVFFESAPGSAKWGHIFLWRRS